LLSPSDSLRAPAEIDPYKPSLNVGPAGRKARRYNLNSISAFRTPHYCNPLAFRFAKQMMRKSISDEHKPLLFKLSSYEPSQKVLDIEMVTDEIEDHQRQLLKVEFSKILKMSGPVIFAYMLQNSLQTGSVLVVGRLVCPEMYSKV
jgi:hypothetical protein